MGQTHDKFFQKHVQTDDNNHLKDEVCLVTGYVWVHAVLRMFECFFKNYRMWMWMHEWKM